MPSRFCRRALLLLVLLPPLLAHADPLDAIGEVLGIALVAGAALLTLVVLTLVLVVLAYLQPQRRGLYYAQLVLLALNGPVGLVLLAATQALREWLPVAINPSWQLVLPLGVWLNAVRWAQQAQADTWRRWWASVAVAALTSLLLVPWSLGLNSWLMHHPNPSQALIGGIFLLLSLVVALVSWAIVIRQLRAVMPAAVWQPWWLPPLLVALLGATYTVFTTSLSFAFITSIQMQPLLLLRIGGQSLVSSWVVGVLALLVLRPARAARRAVE